MAYRQLCSVSFAVLGLVVFGCGGSTGSSTGTGSPTATEQPPNNPDAPAANTDQATASADAPPSSLDSPPGTADAPAGSGAGGRLGSLCRQICSTLVAAIDQCSRGTSMLKVSTDCNSAEACQVPADFVPCENEIASVFQCFIDNVSMLCPADTQNNDQPAPGQGQGQDAAGSSLDICAASVSAATSCATAHHIDLTSNMMDMTTDPNMNPPGRDCTQGNACTQCLCKAAGDATKSNACLMGDCAAAAP